MSVPSFWVRKKGQVSPSSFRACRKAAMVRRARGLRDWLRMAAFSRSIRPNRPSWREGEGGKEREGKGRRERGVRREYRSPNHTGHGRRSSDHQPTPCESVQLSSEHSSFTIPAA